MTDALNAAEAAIYDALSDIPGIFQHPPQDQPLPITIIGDMDNAVPIAGPSDPDRRILLTIVCLTEGEERKPCLERMAMVTSRLREQSFAAEGFTVTAQLISKSAAIEENGAGYNGIIQFMVFALSD